MKKILGWVTYPCMRITEIVESKEAANLTFGDRLKYKTHLTMCKACRSYEKQSTLIGNALSQLMPSSPKNLKTMDDTTKQKMWDKIKMNKE